MNEVSSTLNDNSFSVLAPPGRLYLDCRTIRNIGIYVEKVKPKSPLLSKIHAGDVILGVDGTSTTQLSNFNDFAEMIVLKEASERNLMVAPADIAAPLLRKMAEYEGRAMN